MAIQKTINALRDKQKEIAIGLCMTPARDYATYLKQVGEYAGIDKSIGILQESLREEERDG